MNTGIYTQELIHMLIFLTDHNVSRSFATIWLIPTDCAMVASASKL